MRLSNYVEKNVKIDRDFNIRECLMMGMPNWFISDYVKKATKTINRYSKELGYDCRTSEYKKLVKYRDIR